MKVKITYSFEAQVANPYFASAKYDGKEFCACSDTSFRMSEKNLIVKINNHKKHADIPEPKTIELNN